MEMEDVPLPGAPKEAFAEEAKEVDGLLAANKKKSAEVLRESAKAKEFEDSCKSLIEVMTTTYPSIANDLSFKDFLAYYEATHGLKPSQHTMGMPGMPGTPKIPNMKGFGAGGGDKKKVGCLCCKFSIPNKKFGDSEEEHGHAGEDDQVTIGPGGAKLPLRVWKKGTLFNKAACCDGKCCIIHCKCPKCACPCITTTCRCCCLPCACTCTLVPACCYPLAVALSCCALTKVVEQPDDTNNKMVIKDVGSTPKDFKYQDDKRPRYVTN